MTSIDNVCGLGTRRSRSAKMSADDGTQKKDNMRQLKYKKIPLKDLEFTEGDTVSRDALAVDRSRWCSARGAQLVCDQRPKQANRVW